MKKLFIGLLLFCFSLEATFGANPFWFGIRIQGNDPVLAQKIEKTFGVDIRIITVIYDDFSEKEQSLFLDTIARLGNKRIYHIALNPFGYSAEELLDDPTHKGWEEKYRTFFRIVKEKDLKVIFRPLHEMNGGWYSWSSDPKNYRPLWRLIWQWSREE